MNRAVVAARSAGPEPLWTHRAFIGTLVGAAAAGLTSAWWWKPVSGWLTTFEFALAGILGTEIASRAHWFLLPPIGFASGLLASLSPCVLPLVPLQLAYLGATDTVDRRQAASVAVRFVLGAAAALSVLGLAGDLSGWILVAQRGPTLIALGAMTLYLGFAFLELAPLPGAGRAPGGVRRLGPFGAGAAFSLATTPCASPLLGAVLASATAAALPGLTVVSMVAFALGYTALVLLAGIVGGGLLVGLRGRSFAAPRAVGAALLLAAGLALVVGGARWF
jgi:cytochrome c-type biogenesis protein